MPRSIVLGNGRIQVCIDRHAQVRDFYFPFVGSENHLGGNLVHKIGVWIDGVFSWIDDGSWLVDISCGVETLSSAIVAKNDRLKIRLVFKDVIYNEKNIFIRHITVHNEDGKNRGVRLFLNQQFQIFESFRGDTAFYDPERSVVIHYKGRRKFLINGRTEKSGFDTWSIGEMGRFGREGTFRDAEDGELSRNPIEHGSVDSVIGFFLDVPPGGSESVHYWITVGELTEDIYGLNDYVLLKSPAHLIQTTQDYWHAWVNRQNFSFYNLRPEIVALFKKSLFYMRAHVDNRGSIIASGDSDMLQQGKDTYSYMWPRDGAYTAIALAKAGDYRLARQFFAFCNDVLRIEGYMMHKFLPDRSLGSSWHPWVRGGKRILPIQEDETALVLYALRDYYRLSKDLEFIEEIFNSFIKPAADFLVSYRDPKTHLPLPSYDLWEERYGVHTFTAAAVSGALGVAAEFSTILGKSDIGARYEEAKKEVEAAILAFLYNEDEGYFYKMQTDERGVVAYDKTIDMSSVYGIYNFNILPPDDSRVVRAVKITEERLSSAAGCGMARYEGDMYYRSPGVSGPGNPWFITSLWLAQYYIARAKTEDDLEPVIKCFNWVFDHALPSGVLSEQIDPYSNGQVSAAPLTWSHAAFVESVIKYLEKLEELGICKTCYPIS
ncbi:glycoside hydrolase family 15 protein [bacterium]|nr:glycoside hydrolase family 15 protein [bacterium]